MAGKCLDCDGCCRVFEVKALKKPFGVPCKHLGKTPLGPGCTIHMTRPEVCRNYQCLWLYTQGTNRPLPPNLRPNVCKVVMGWPYGIDRETLFVYPYPGHDDAWRFPPVSEHLKLILSRGGKIVVVSGTKRIAIKGNMAIIGTEDEFAELLSDGG